MTERLGRGAGDPQPGGVPLASLVARPDDPGGQPDMLVRNHRGSSLTPAGLLPLVFIVAIVSGLESGQAYQGLPGPEGVSPVEARRVGGKDARLPVHFEQLPGPSESNVDYLVRGDGYVARLNG